MLQILFLVFLSSATHPVSSLSVAEGWPWSWKPKSKKAEAAPAEARHGEQPSAPRAPLSALQIDVGQVEEKKAETPQVQQTQQAQPYVLLVDGMACTNMHYTGKLVADATACGAEAVSLSSCNPNFVMLTAVTWAINLCYCAAAAGDPCTHRVSNPAYAIFVPEATNGLAGDDPHLVSVSGNEFDVNQPGEYTLVRAPADSTLPAKLKVNASLSAAGSSPCHLYIQEMQLSGAWLGEMVVKVWPLQRDMPGSNGAGNTTLRPFSLQVEGGLHSAAVVHYEPWAKEFTKRLSERVYVQSVWRQPYAESGRVMEAEAFRFFIEGGSAQVASVEVAQASHQALNVEAAGLIGLGFDQLGGLLGTEGHDQKIEHVTSACAAFKQTNNDKQMRVGEPWSDAGTGSVMRAYLH